MINKIDKNFLYTSLALVVVGFMIFFSAAMGDLDRESVFAKNIIKQGVILILGIFAMFYIAKSEKITSKFLRRNS